MGRMTTVMPFYEGKGIVRINSYMVMWFPPWGHRPPEHEVNLLGEADPETRVPRDSTQTYLLMQRPSTGKVWFWNTLGYD